MTSSQPAPSRLQDLTGRSHGLPCRFHDRPGRVHDRACSSGDFAGSSGDLPSSSGDLAGSSGDLPGSSGDFPSSSGDFPGSPNRSAGSLRRRTSALRACASPSHGCTARLARPLERTASPHEGVARARVPVALTSNRAQGSPGEPHARASVLRAPLVTSSSRPRDIEVLRGVSAGAQELRGHKDVTRAMIQTRACGSRYSDLAIFAGPAGWFPWEAAAARQFSIPPAGRTGRTRIRRPLRGSAGIDDLFVAPLRSAAPRPPPGTSRSRPTFGGRAATG